MFGQYLYMKILRLSSEAAEVLTDFKGQNVTGILTTMAEVCVREVST